MDGKVTFMVMVLVEKRREPVLFLKRKVGGVIEPFKQLVLVLLVSG